MHQPTPAADAARRMSLRGRVMLAILSAFLVSLPAGAALSLWQGRRSVETELRAALDAGVVAARAAVDETRAGGDAAGDRRLLDRFRGGRHVEVALLDARGRRRLAFTPPPPSDPPPSWFVRLLDPRLEPVRIAAPGGAVLAVASRPENEAAEIWSSYRNGLAVFGLFGAVALALVLPAVSHALRPLSSVSRALPRVAEGDYGVRVPELGSREAFELSRGFNAMAGRLERVEAENRRLHAQLLTLQEEERADLARDLHDEVGPYLFAMEIDVAATRELARAHGWREVESRTGLVAAALSHVQGHVRDMLARLRPDRAVELGLAGAIEDLVAFWRARRRDIDFRIQVEASEDALGLAQRETLYRVAQEALSNAVRHGRPSRIDVSLRAGEAGGARLEVRDDGGGPPAGAAHGRYGLSGMRERLAAVDGELTIVQESGGWRVLAALPEPVDEEAALR
jgi:two-component system sensor histidine kinase UhpB